MKLGALELVSAWLHGHLSQFPIISGASFSMCSSPPTLFPLLITIWRLALDAHRHFANSRIFNYPSSDRRRVIFAQQIYIHESCASLLPEMNNHTHFPLLQNTEQQQPMPSWVSSAFLPQMLLDLSMVPAVDRNAFNSGSASRCILSVLFLCVQMENVTMEPAISEGLIWFLINENSVTFGMGYI